MSEFRIIKKERINSKYFNEWVYNDINKYDKRYNVYYGGAGSGKSYGAVQKIIIKAYFNKRKVLVVRKVGNTLRHSIYALFKSTLSKLGYAYKENKTDMTLTFEKSGSVFIFKGIADPEKIKSIADITDIVIEECTELTKDDFTQLDLRLRPNEKYPQIYMMFNPVSKANWVYEHWFLNKEEDASVIQSSYMDNKFLSEKYRQTLNRLKQTNPAYYRIYCLGEFATLDKLVFPIIDKRLISEEEVKDMKFFAGLDFGYVNDPTAIVWGRYDSDNKIIYVMGEYFKTGMLNDEIANTIKALGLSKEVIIADCAEKKSIQEIKNLGVYRIKPCSKGKNSVIHGLQWLQQNKIVVDTRCVKIIEEFENYTWVKDKKTNEYINEPIDSFNHGIDALRYALYKNMKGSGISFME